MDWHLVTCEYPPRVGGVADHTRLVAEGLAAAGDCVQVWCPSDEGEAASSSEGVTVRREMGDFRPADLRRVGRALDEFASPRRLLVQWVPHGYGYRSMNVWFCLWLCARAFVRRDEVNIIVHEPFLAFGEGSWRQDLVALVHRLMTTALLASARRVWTTIPKWEEYWRPYAFGRRVPFGWLPVPSTTPVVETSAEEAAATRSLYAGKGVALVGHFGTYGELVARTLRELLPRLLSVPETDCAVLLLGQGSGAMREELLHAHPQLANRIHATGTLSPPDLSRHLAACDLLVQPYPDGVSTRRTSIMAGLAHGRAVVTTDGRLTEPFWRESGAVALAPAGDVEGLARAVCGLLGDAAGREELGERARAAYALHFDLQHLKAKLRQGHEEGEPRELGAATTTV